LEIYKVRVLIQIVLDVLISKGFIGVFFLCLKKEKYLPEFKTPNLSRSSA
jgi:hypothetical protein